MILKERPEEGPKLDVKMLKHLASHTDIPVPKVVRDWADRSGRYFVLEERIDGETLERPGLRYHNPKNRYRRSNYGSA